MNASLIQRQFWLVNQLYPGTKAYNLPLAFIVKGKISVERLVFSIESEIKANKLFSAKLEYVDNQLKLLPVEADNFKVERIKVPSYSNLEDTFKELIEASVTNSLDISKGELIHSAIYEFSEEVFGLIIVIHHIAVDWDGKKSLIDNIVRRYNNVKVENQYNYNDFTEWQLKWLDSDEAKKKLKNTSKFINPENNVINFPNNRANLKTSRTNLGIYEDSFNKELTGNINNLCSEFKLNDFTVVLTAYYCVIAKYSGKDKLTIGIPFTNRVKEEWAKTIGCFVNILPITIDNILTSDFYSLLKQVRTKLLFAHRCQEIPTELLVKEYSIKHNQNYNPFYQHGFTFEELIDFELDDAEVTPVSYSRGAPQLDIFLFAWHTNSGIQYRFEFDKEIYKFQDIVVLSDTMKEILSLDSAALKLPISDFSYKYDNTSFGLNTINITGTFTTEPVEKALKFWTQKIDFPSHIQFVGFNQVFQQLFDPQSIFNSQADQLNVIFIRPEDFLISDGNLKENVDEVINELKEAIANNLQLVSTNKLITVFCPASDNFARDVEFITKTQVLENSIKELTDAYSNLFVILTRDFTEKYALTDYYEPLGEKQGNIPYKENFFACAATLLARKIYSLVTPPFKAIVLDCDNTLWQGVVGEDGPTGVKVGKQEAVLQKFLIQQQQAGVILCLCSKNVDKDVWEVFEQNDQMLLTRDHISFSKINWESKSQNIISLAKEINIGLDSFVFIDDNIIECEEVRTHVPSVLTIQKNNDIEDITYITNAWVFDRNKITAEDKKRASMYKDEAERLNLKSNLKTYKDFINELNIQIDIEPVSTVDIPRISQLTFRTNQFNFTTIRRSEDEIKSLLEKDNYQLKLASLKDKYGEYGIIGAMIFCEGEEHIDVDTFLLSCRALGKGVEHAMIAHIGQFAEGKNKKFVDIAFRKTEKNVAAEKFLIESFIRFQSIQPDKTIFHLPTEIVQDFKFDPDSVKIQSDTPVKTNQVEAKPNIVFRNNLLGEINADFSNLRDIEAAIYSSKKQKSEKTSTHKSPGKLENEILKIWQEVLENPDITKTDNFFDAGGQSISIPQIVIRLKNELDISINIVDVFQYPTVQALAKYISPKDEKSLSVETKESLRKTKIAGFENEGFAIIGMTGRFPGAENINEFWEIIKNGTETISEYTREELEKKGVPQELLDDPNYVYKIGTIPTADMFDASFFGFTPKEADFMDPQHRIFLESCHEALEAAGYYSERYNGSIGVFGGSGPDNYILKNLFQHPDSLRSMGEFQTIVNNGKDFITTHVSYKLNLDGPSMNVQTACSTSMVAIHYACQNLMTYQCDIALAGGAFVHTPRQRGYMYEPGGIFSPKGQCRPFDKNADGTLFGEGVGVVVLKRYQDAIRDNDTIWGIVKGSALNNDGSDKVGYMAPSVTGQSKVIARAHSFANVKPSDISYIEAHGTGTKLGDPIEVKALTKVFREDTSEKEICALGSVKANIGHLDAAAGVTGFIKTVLALKNKQLPPLVNFKAPNPELQLEESPFYINTNLKDWDTNGKPRIAGISSFGVGGTNVHCLVQEAPEVISEASKKEYHILPLSAKTESALKAQKQNLISYLETNEANIADIAFTLLEGRKRYKYRSTIICKSTDEAIEKIKRATIGKTPFNNPLVTFLFTGQGSQYYNMARGLYDEFPKFAEILDNAFSLAREGHQLDLKKILFSEEYKEQINNTAFAQPALFVIQYSLAQLLISFGISPNALIGHSIGEITAACISGLFTFEDALKLVIVRGRLMQAQKPGTMLSVQMPAGKVKDILPDNLDLALINAPNFSVVSGETNDIEAFQKEMESKFPDILITKLKTSHAFHSRMMDPALKEFRKELSTIHFAEISIPFVSNTTGTWADTDTVANAEYWVKHIRSAVNFVDGVNTLLEDNNRMFLEVGPGLSLTTLLAQFEKKGQKIISLPTLRHPRKNVDDVDFFFEALADLWNNGADSIFDNWYIDEERKRIPLPTYPFERKRHWVDPIIPFDYHTSKTGGVVASATQVDIDESAIQSDSALSNLHERPELSTAYTAPTNDSESKLLAIWQELLGIDKIGIDDDFFELGGHSLLASQVSTRISEMFNKHLPLEGLFNAPTIRALVSTYELSYAEESDASKLETITEEWTEYPISIEQRRLWIINKIDIENPAYNIPFTYRLKGELDIAVLQESIAILFERHKVLNSYIPTIDDQPQIKFLPTKPQIDVIDRSYSSGDDNDAFIQEYFSKESRDTFDLETGPLYRIILVKLSDNDYVFHLTVQHAIFDGWSWGIFTDELNHIYNALKQNRSIDLPVPENQYFDFSYWQSKQIKSDFYKESLDFWLKNLENVPTETNFPYDRKRPAELTGLGGREAFSIDEELTSKIKSVCKENDVTLFMAMLTTFGILTNLYSGDDDICIGSPTGNRIKSSFEKIIGFFVNTIIFRLKIDRNKSFFEILNKNRKTILDSLEYQGMSFEELVDHIQPERIININPLFQIMFAWQNAPRPPLSLEGIEVERIMLKECISPLDITFYMWEANNQIEGEIEFNTDILDRESIVHLKNNYVKLLEEIVNRLNEPISNYNYISDYTADFVSELNDTKFELPEKLLHELFIEKVEAYSDKTAVICDNKSLTYAELDKLSNKLANKLIKSGIKPGDVVGIGLTPTLQQIVTVFGVLKTGAAYLPMDPSFPDERLQYILQDSGAEFLVAHKFVIDNLQLDSSINTLVFDSLDAFDENSDLLHTKSVVTQESLAYMIYTSGSTGNPKGVPIHHRAVLNFILSMAQTPGLSDTDNLLSVTTLSFDISILEIFLPLSFGATLVLANENERISSDLYKLIENHDITILQATPATWNILLNSDWQGSPNLKALCGGEAMPPSLAKSLLPKVAELWNMYGPTETTVWSSCKQIIQSDPPILVGKPIGNTDFFVLDTNNNKLPVNVEGEITIGGEGLSKGYYQREELTAEKFIQVDGELLYKTGDNGRIRADGEIEILGRKDNQIKIRGFRLEPGEIEAKLCQIDGITEAVVKVHKFDELDHRLVAFILCANESKENLDKEGISSHIQKHLPDYMVPSHYQFMDEFPRTPNKKTDRKKLVFTLDEEIQTPEIEQNLSSMEASVLEIWKQELKSGHINIDEDFFHLGGGSLIALKMLSQVERDYKCKISYRDFLMNLNTIRKMAAYLEDLKQSKADELQTGESRDYFYNPGDSKLKFGDTDFTKSDEIINADDDFKKNWRKNNKGAQYKNLVLRKPDGNRGPLFMVYAEGLFYYKSISLDKNRKIYNFIDLGSDGEKIPFSDLKTMAKAHLDQLLEVEPEGPYFIGGFSFGGLIAYEMAQQLQKLGKKVPCIFLLDTFNPQVVDKRYKQKRLRQNWKNPFSIIIPYIQKKYISKSIYSFYFRIGKTVPIKYRHHYVRNKYLELMKGYYPEKLDADLMLFRAEDNVHFAKDLGWGSMVNKLDFIELEGHHLSIFENKDKSEKLWSYIYKYIKKHDKF